MWFSRLLLLFASRSLLLVVVVLDGGAVRSALAWERVGHTFSLPLPGAGESECARLWTSSCVFTHSGISAMEWNTSIILPLSRVSVRNESMCVLWRERERAMKTSHKEKNTREWEPNWTRARVCFAKFIELARRHYQTRSRSWLNSAIALFGHRKRSMVQMRQDEFG